MTHLQSPKRATLPHRGISIPDKASLQKPILINLRLDALGEVFHLLAQVGDEFCVGGIVALGVHIAFGVGALEMQAYVVERSVGFPTVVGIEKLVAVVEPSGFNAMADRDVNL